MIDHTIKVAEIQADQMIKALDKPRAPLPRSVSDNGDIRMVGSGDWTSGFFPGSLWYLYEATGNSKWLEQAKSFTAQLEREQYNTGTHDIGFMMYCSYGNGYRLTQTPKYKDVLLQSAESLASRFDPNVGCIRSWDFFQHKWEYPVIIDNMMNLELLFWAAKASGNSKFYNIAVSHASTTLYNHFREDGSCWHVVNYDKQNGNVKNRQTQQGFSDDSSWARGHSWAVYGFTLCYRETGDERYLKQACKTADYVLNHPNMPDDHIAYWDLEAPNIPDEPRDASSAAILCSALYELSTYAKSGTSYRQAADQILHSLCSDAYLAQPGRNYYFLLKHSVGSKPEHSEVDVPLIYADYYLIEAILRKHSLTSKHGKTQHTNQSNQLRHLYDLE